MKWLENLWDKTKGVLGDKDYGGWILGGIGALIGLAAGGVSIVGFLLAAGLAMLAMVYAAPKVAEWATGQKAGGSPFTNPFGSGNEPQVARPLEPQVSIGTPQQDKENIYTMPADLDGQKYDLRMRVSHKKGNATVDTIEYKKPDDKGYASYTFSRPVTIGSIDENGKPVFDQALLKEMGKSLVDKKIRSDSRAGVRAEGMEGYPIDKDAKIILVRSKQSAYLVKAAGGGQINVSTLNGGDVGTVKLSDATLANFADEKTRGIAARAAGDMIREWEGIPANKSNLVPLSRSAAGLALPENEVLLIKDTDDGKKVKKEGTFTLKDDNTVYRYVMQTDKEKNSKGEVVANGVAIYVDGTDINDKRNIIVSEPISGGKAIGAFSDAIVKGGDTFTYLPNEANIQSLVTKALNNNDRVKGIANLGKYLDDMGLKGGAATGPQRFLLEVPGGGAYEIAITRKAADKFNVTIKNEAEDKERSIEGDFKTVPAAIKAALRATGEKAGPKGENIMNSVMNENGFTPSYVPATQPPRGVSGVELG